MTTRGSLGTSLTTQASYTSPDIALVGLDRLAVEVDPDLITDVPADLVVEDLAVQTVRRTAKPKITVPDAED